MSDADDLAAQVLAAIEDHQQCEWIKAQTEWIMDLPLADRARAWDAVERTMEYELHRYRSSVLGLWWVVVAGVAPGVARERWLT